MDHLKQFLIEQHTNPDIAQFILTSLESFRKSPTQRQLQHLTRHPWQRDIQDIRIFHLLSGFIPNSLLAAQQQHYLEMGTWKSGTLWAGRMIYQFWLFIHQMWLGQNTVLHQKNIINQMSGEALLDIEVKREYDQGYANRLQ
jgi:hypothetical protein